MKHYLLFFAAVYSIALVLLITVLIFGLNLGGLTLLPTLVAAAFISAGHFIKKEQRLPSSDEKIQLVWGSSAVAIIIGSFFVFFLVLMNPNAEAILKAADKAGLALAAVVMLCLIAIHGAVFHIAYGWYANRYYHKKFLQG
ncbi:ABZJ_00895 family protein [Acinetobacter towneri]|uniref:ABZJ_00895 family protein n=1 Tax=Acinetobacter towneri TaxID=202956 RepID=UPI00336C14C7